MERITITISPRGLSIQQKTDWRKLKEYMRKGFALDDERLKKSGWRRILQEAAGAYLYSKIRIIDHGTGISPKDMPRIF